MNRAFFCVSASAASVSVIGTGVLVYHALEYKNNRRLLNDFDEIYKKVERIDYDEHKSDEK